MWTKVFRQQVASHETPKRPLICRQKKPYTIPFKDMMLLAVIIKQSLKAGWLLRSQKNHVLSRNTEIKLHVYFLKLKGFGPCFNRKFFSTVDVPDCYAKIIWAIIPSCEKYPSFIPFYHWCIPRIHGTGTFTYTFLKINHPCTPQKFNIDLDTVKYPKWQCLKGITFSKPSFWVAMLVFRGVGRYIYIYI